ncbi:MAG: 8-amino-7-oxononanoate synthase [Catenulispora sp.]
MTTSDQPGDPGHPLSWLAERADQRRAAGLRRSLVPRASSAQSPLIDLAGNDYLGLTRHPEVIAGAVAAVQEWGAGSTGSRLVTGTTELHAALEAELAEFAGAEAALVFSSGYLANLGVITALAGRGDLIVSDSLNHASLIDAARLSRARIAVTPHNDVAAVARELADRPEARALVVVESLFSVDGDTAPLRELHAACRAHGAVLVVDEAHGFGVAGPGGRGAVFDAGLAGQPDVVVAATMSKALGSQGGAILGSAELIAHLVDAARSMIFDTGLAPAPVGAALAALRLIRRDPGLPELVRKRSRELYELAVELGFRATPPAGAVASIVLGEPEVALAAAAFCRERGLRIGCFRPPSVPDGLSRLRVTARADLSDIEMDQVRSVLRDLAKNSPQV